MTIQIPAEMAMQLLDGIRAVNSKHDVDIVIVAIDSEGSPSVVSTVHPDLMRALFAILMHVDVPESSVTFQSEDEIRAARKGKS